jgi:F-type H+-transporting ATPase subunit delta
MVARDAILRCNACADLYCGNAISQVATVRSAVKLDQSQQAAIAKKLQQLTKSKNIKLKTIIDQVC